MANQNPLRFLRLPPLMPPPAAPPLAAAPPAPKLDRAPPPPRPPPMVLVERCVEFVDELEETIKEIGGLLLPSCLDSAISDIPAGTSTSERGALQNRAIAEVMDRREKDEERAFEILCGRKASRPPAVRKEPLPQAAPPFIYAKLLDGIEPSLSSSVAAPPTVTTLSLKISWPPGHLLNGYPSTAFIASCHSCFLLLNVGSYRPGTRKPGFYLVYNACANSVAIVPPHFRVRDTSHCDIGAGAVLLCCSGNKEEPDYILAELLLHRKDTNKATLFIWGSSTGKWVERELLQLPFPVPAVAADHEQGTTTGTCSFHADMVFAVSFSSICWVDLLTGILVYNHMPRGEFHFIPLPEECVTGMPRYGQRPPEEYRSMCCIDRKTLRFVSMDTCSQECPMLTTWTLRRPLSPTNYEWEKDPVSSFRMQDLWEDPVYKDKMKLRPLIPRCPVISTQEHDIIYLSVIDYHHSDDLLEFRGSYVFSINVGRCRVESAYTVPADKNGNVAHPRIFTSDFSSYLNKTKPADDGESRSNLSTLYTVDPGMLKLSTRARLGVPLVIPTPGTALGPSSRITVPLASSFYRVGLQAALDIAMAEAA